MRFTFSDNQIIADTDGKNDGRGTYLCRDKKCIEQALKRKAFNRVLRTNVDAESIERAISRIFGD